MENMTKEIYTFVKTFVEDIKNTTNFAERCSTEEGINDLINELMPNLYRDFKTTFLKSKLESINVDFLKNIFGNLDSDSFTNSIMFKFSTAKDSNEMRKIYNELWEDANKRHMNVSEFLKILDCGQYKCKKIGFDQDTWFKNEKLRPIIYTIIKCGNYGTKSLNVPISQKPINNEPVEIGHDLNNNFDINNFVKDAKKSENISVGQITNTIFTNQQTNQVSYNTTTPIYPNPDPRPMATVNDKLQEIRSRINFLDGKHRGDNGITVNDLNGLLLLIDNNYIKNRLYQYGITNVNDVILHEIEISKYQDINNHEYNFAFEVKCNDSHHIVIKYNTVRSYIPEYRVIDNRFNIYKI